LARINVLVADDDPLMRDALSEVVESAADLELAGVAASADEAGELAAASQAQVALIDMRMPRGGGQAAAAAIHYRSPSTRLLVLSALDDRALITEMVGLGAHGYLLKGTESEEIVEAIRRTARGQFSMSTEIAASSFGMLIEQAASGRESERLRQLAETRLRGMYDASPAAIVIVDGEGRILTVNPRATTLFRADVDALVGKPVTSLLTPASARSGGLRLRRVAAGAASVVTRVTGLHCRRPDGTEFPAEAMLTSVATSGGPEGVIAFNDLDQSRGGATLFPDRSLFQQVVDVAPDAMVVVDKDGVIELVNQQAERLFGYERQEMLRAKIELLIPKRLAKRHVGHRAGFLQDPRVRPMGFGLDLAGRRKDGSEFPVDISLSPFETPGGVMVVGAIRDITDRRRAEEAHRKDEARLRQLVDASPDGVVIIDAQGVMQEVNSQAEALFGYPRRHLVGQAVEMLLPERFRSTHIGHRGRYLARPRQRPMGLGLELAGRRADGTEFPVDISLAHLETADGVLGVAFIRDVTERRRAEHNLVLTQLVRAQEEERLRIASDIHDDVIQAITASGLRLQLLRRQLSEPAHLETLAKLEETVQIAITRLRSLMFDLRPPELDNGGILAALRSMLEQFQSETGVAFTLSGQASNEPSPQLLTILYRLFQEALANVRKHARASRIKVRLEQSDGGYSGMVDDDGLGFDVAATKPRPGHLGLSAMVERAEMAHGRVHVVSSPGKGTKVSFWLPGDPAAQ
jgi:PAS domain S-box-containing protein